MVESSQMESERKKYDSRVEITPQERNDWETIFKVFDTKVPKEAQDLHFSMNDKVTGMEISFQLIPFFRIKGRPPVIRILVGRAVANSWDPMFTMSAMVEWRGLRPRLTMSEYRLDSPLYSNDDIPETLGAIAHSLDTEKEFLPEPPIQRKIN